MKPDEWLKHYIEYTDKRFDKIEQKIDGLSRFRYVIFGGGLVSVFIINLVIQILIK